ncbi:hypothetical protein KGQ71_01620 [Patescibacteria group bacterium]|nr:hypothetical protein [Patescibacteria group bacterium]
MSLRKDEMDHQMAALPGVTTGAFGLKNRLDDEVAQKVEVKNTLLPFGLLLLFALSLD